jgi:hypothetical protein
MAMSAMTRWVVLLGLVGLVTAGCGGSTTPTVDEVTPTTSTAPEAAGGGAAASCAAAVRYDGNLYLGQGQLRRDPATTGRLVDGSVPPCNDTGGASEEAEPAQLAELEDVPVETAVLFNGGVYVREGADLPASTEPWFTAPDCTSDGEFDLVGDWLGVESHHQPRYDGDIRPPYRVEVHVTEGPADYLGATIQVHADSDTDPTLGPDDVKESLWEGGQVMALTRCADGRFEAVSLRVPPAE